MSTQPIDSGEQEGRSWRGASPLVPAARQRLLEAAARCIARDGLGATGMAPIAAEAGVSRQTLYRYFSSRDELIGHTLRAAAEEVRSRIGGHLRGLSDPADMIVEAILLGLAELRRDPVLRAVSDSLGLGGFVSTRIDPQGIAWTRETLSPVIEAAGWREPEVDSAIEFVLRVFFSLASSPSPDRSDEELRAFLYRHLVPGVGLLTAEEP